MADFDPTKYGKPVSEDFDPTQFGKLLDEQQPEQPNYTQTLVPQGAEIRAGKSSWLDDAESDLRYGGTRTLPGKVLNFLGAKGINLGVSEGAADKMASPLVGSINAARGIAKTPQHPIAGPLEAIGGALQAAEIPLAFMGGPAANKAINAIPSKALASKSLSEVMDVAKDVPINPNGAKQVALRVQELSKRGGQMPQVIRNFLNRVSSKPAVFPNAPDSVAPLTYQEARDFYSNASRLSADEFNKLTPVMQRQVAMFTKALGKSITEAADTVGLGSKYTGAMKEYAQAMKLKGFSDAAIDFFVKRLIPAGVIGAAGYEGYKLMK